MTYVFVDPDFEGPNNLRLSLTFALTLARLLNRTLVLWCTSRAGNLKQSEVSWGVRRERKGKR